MAGTTGGEVAGRFLLSGELPHLRVPRGDRGDRGDRLRAVRGSGLEGASIYVPWNWRQSEPGTLDVTGRTAPERDLVGPLETIAAAGLAGILRPGPFVSAEWHNGGSPDWLLEGDPGIRAWSTKDAPVADGGDDPAITHAHPACRAGAERWLEEVLGETADLRSGRGGPIGEVQYLSGIPATKFSAKAHRRGLEVGTTHEADRLWRPPDQGPPVCMEFQGSNASHISPGATGTPAALSAARGIQGINVFMMVRGANPRGYENQTGASCDICAPVGRNKSRRPHGEVIAKLARVVRAGEHTLLSTSPSRDVAVGAVVDDHAASTSGTAWALDEWGPQTLFPSGDMGLSEANGVPAISANQSINWGMVDLGAAGGEPESAARVWVGTLRRSARPLAERLARFTEGGGDLVRLPLVPEEDERSAPCAILARWAFGEGPVPGSGSPATPTGTGPRGTAGGSSRGTAGGGRPGAATRALPPSRPPGPAGGSSAGSTWARPPGRRPSPTLPRARNPLRAGPWHRFPGPTGDGSPRSWTGCPPQGGAPGCSPLGIPLGGGHRLLLATAQMVGRTSSPGAGRTAVLLEAQGPEISVNVLLGPTLGPGLAQS